MSINSLSRRKAGGATVDSGGISKASGQDKQRMLLAADVGHFSMIRALHLADVITCMNLFCGYMSITWSVRYSGMYAALNPHSPVGFEHETRQAMWLALVFIPLGLFFDFFDGKVARWRGKSSLMGQELDSLADLVSFGVAPATAAFALGLNTLADHLILAFFVLCTLCRLARFNVTVASLPKDGTGKSRYFEGFPAPTSLAIVGWMAYWLYEGTIHDDIPGGILAGGSPLEFHPVVIIFVLWGSLMVSRTIHIPKP